MRDTTLRTAATQAVRSKNPPSRRSSEDRGRKWSTNLRVRQRHGMTEYAVEFSDGRLWATVYGAFASGTIAQAQAEAEKARLSWLQHVAPVPRKIKEPYRRVYFPKNKAHHKSHRGFGRAA